ncbi:HD domain-containing protein, partial [Candidatus Micrarchaeota archaeon]|nr:HD domain-containing protein [Candidatus Micrarchaeota archaeon]
MIDFLYEVGLLKRTPRSGWLTIGIKDCESVAEHSFRCAILGYVLARMEKANVEKIVLLCLFHDVPEARIGDLHLIARKYVSKNYKKLVKDITS